MKRNVHKVQSSTEEMHKKDTFPVSSILFGLSAFISYAASTYLEKVSPTLLLPIYIIMGLTTLLYIYGFFLRQSNTSTLNSVRYFYITFLILLSIQGIFAGNVSAVADYYKDATMVWNDYLLISIAQYLFFSTLVAIIVYFLSTYILLNQETITENQYFLTMGSSVIFVFLSFFAMDMVHNYFFPPSDVLDHASLIVMASIVMGYCGIGSLVFLNRLKNKTVT